MKSLKECVRESIFDVEDNIRDLNVAIDIYGTTKRVLNRFKEISPVWIDNILSQALEAKAVNRILKQELCKSDAEAEAVLGFFKHMFSKYQNILMVEWCEDVDWDEYPRLYDIHKSHTKDDMEMAEKFNLWVDNWSKVDSWIAGYDKIDDLSFFLSTSKDMTKEEKQVWEVLMKLVCNYYK